MYDGLGGDDIVTLPSVGNFKENVGGGDKLNWSSTTPFQTGSQPGDNYTIYGSPGNHIIVGGLGQETYDYADGDFASFAQFQSGDTETITGGHSTFQLLPTSPSAQTTQNIIKLPGAPNDYSIAVNYKGANWFSTTTTEITTDGAGGLPNGVTIDATGVEDVQFAQTVQGLDVDLTGGTVAAEMLELAAEVYGPNPTLGHTAEPLAYDDPNQRQSQISQAAAFRNWVPVSAIQLGIAPADFNPVGNLKYSFSNGVYQAVDPSVHLPFSADPPEGDAMVLTGDVNGTPTLAITFRGTDQVADFADYANFSSYYKLFAPLIAGIQAYLANSDNGIKQVVVSGHSLGAAMVQYFMSQFPDTKDGNSGYNVYGYTDGSPGAEVDASDPQIENFIDSGDPVSLVPTVTSALGEVAIAAGVSALAGSVAGVAVRGILASIASKSRNDSSITFDNDIPVPLNSAGLFNEHNNKLYEQELGILSNFANDDESPFSGSPLATDLLNNQTYTGSLRIALAGVGGAATAVPAYVPGTTELTTSELPEERLVHLKLGDDYALGNDVGIPDLNRDQFVWNTPSTSDVHIVDGGPSKNAVVDMPLYQSWYTISQPITTKYGQETVISLDLPSILSTLNGVVGDLYRVSEIVFTGLNLFHLPSPNSLGPPVVLTNGAAASVQQASPTQTALTVDPSYDYVETGAANLTVTGSGNGDIIAIGTGNVTINETTGDNTIFVRNAATAGNLTIHAGSGDNEIVAGDGDNTLIGGIGNDTFALGSGANFVNGNGGDATVVLNGDESAYSFSDAVQPDGTVGALVTQSEPTSGAAAALASPLGLTENDGTDTLVGVQSLQFADRDANLITGTSGNDTFTDPGGNSVIIGGGGNDTLFAAELTQAETEFSFNRFDDLELSAPSEFDISVGVDTIDLADATITLFGTGSTQQLEIKETAPTVEDGLAALVSDGSALSSIITTSGTVAVSVATFLADQSTLDKIVGGYAVSDTAANITAALDNLSGVKVSSITISDNGVVGVSSAELKSDASILGKLRNANSSPLQLALEGPGTFNLALPTTLTNVQTITATEGQAAYSGGGQTFAAQNQIVVLRAGLNATVNVESDASLNANDPKPATIIIVGAANSDVINLASGNDVVTVGGSNETVNLGLGNDTINVNAATIGATIGNGTGHNTLDVTGGGTMTMGAHISDIAEALLSPASTAYHFTANAISGLTINDSSTATADVLIAGGAHQTLTGDGAGKVEFVGAAAGDDIFKNLAALFNGDTISGFGNNGDVIDLTDVSSTGLKPLSYVQTTATSGKLTVSDGTHTAAITLLGQYMANGFHSASDGGLGTAITYQPTPQIAALSTSHHA